MPHELIFLVIIGVIIGIKWLSDVVPTEIWYILGAIVFICSAIGAWIESQKTEEEKKKEIDKAIHDLLN